MTGKRPERSFRSVRFEKACFQFEAMYLERSQVINQACRIVAVPKLSDAIMLLTWCIPALQWKKAVTS